MDQLKGLEKDSEEYINALQKLLRNTKDRNKRKTEKLKRTAADGDDSDKPKPSYSKQLKLDPYIAGSENQITDDDVEIIEGSLAGSSTSSQITTPTTLTKKTGKETLDSDDDGDASTSTPAIGPTSLTSKTPRKKTKVLDSDDDSSESDSDEDTPPEIDSGRFVFTEDSVIDTNLISVVRGKDNNYSVNYDGKSQLIFQSGKFVGDLRIFEGKFSPSIYIKKSEIMKKFLAALQQKVGKKLLLDFYGRKESECMAVYCQTLKRADSDACIEACVRGEDKVIPLESIPSLSPALMEVMLESKGLKKELGKKCLWKLQGVHIKVSDIPDSCKGYFSPSKLTSYYK